jgi:hypothetical protein
MSRVTPAEVTAIVETTLTDTIVQIWIDAASEIVDQKADCIGASDTDLLKQVELYLSAHMVAMLPTGGSGGVVSREKFDVMETTYVTASIDKLIDSTVYGQTANQLSGGCLSDINDQKASFASIGLDC